MKERKEVIIRKELEKIRENKEQLKSKGLYSKRVRNDANVKRIKGGRKWKMESYRF